MSSFFLGLPADDIYFLLVMLLAAAVILPMAKGFLRQDQFAQRVKVLHERRAQLKAELVAPRKRQKSPTIIHMSLIRSIVNKMNLLQKSQIGKMNKMLVNAGYRSKDAIFVFAFFQLVSPIGILAIALFSADINFSDPFANIWKLAFVLGAAYLGVKLPSILVINKRNKRYYAIQKGLSDTLDLLMICAESGLSLASGLDRVSRELGGAYPEMAEELGLTSVELGFLPDRKRALMNLVERVDIPEIRGIVSVLIQTEKYGTPIAQALRTLAAEFREQRMLRAEQKAARLPAIMTVPMILFILPTLFIIIMAPALIKLMHELAH